MKIEKVNDNQIRCTLTKEDLADRQIRLSELAYGSDKARALFQDMIQQANYEVGFEAEDVPLMVEAIPISADSIILVITKVEYPEELDTRFSRFSEPDPDLLGDLIPPKEPKAKEGAADIVDLFKKAYDQLAKSKAAPAEDKAKEDKPKEKAAEEKAAPETVIPAELKDFTRLFELPDIGGAERLAKVLSGFYQGQSALYKNPQGGSYFLTLHKGEHSPEEFNKVCNIAAEYAVQRPYTKSMDAYFIEHDYGILKDDAIKTLSQLS